MLLSFVSLRDASIWPGTVTHAYNHNTLEHSSQPVGLFQSESSLCYPVSSRIAWQLSKNLSKNNKEQANNNADILRGGGNTHILREGDSENENLPDLNFNN